MREAAAFSSLGLTVGLVLARPRLINGYRVGPAIAALCGVIVMAAIGTIHLHDVGETARVLWRPLLTIASIMTVAACAMRLGVVARVAASLFTRAHGSPGTLFLLVFALAAGTAAVLNNDSAVLLVTPIVIGGVRALYPRRPDLIAPFAFAVFMAAGVAPLVTANPMNLIVADYAHLNFNSYAVRILPISIAGWVLTAIILRWLFSKELERPDGQRPEQLPTASPWTRYEIHGLVLVIVVLAAYPVVSYLGGSVWVVASGGALAALWLCSHHARGGPRDVLVHDVSWEIVVFLFGVFMLAIGLRNAGLTHQLSELYTRGGDWVIGAVSAGGSALINNHSMALTNLLALKGTPHVHQHAFLAALIGGDLGPRLMPMGSLAGLLWYSWLRRLDVSVSVWRFISIGAVVTIPALLLSLGLLEAGA